LVDPFGRELDLSDHKYLFKDVYMEKEELINLYPSFKAEIENIPSVTKWATDAVNNRLNYHVREVWYKEYKYEHYLIDAARGETYKVERSKLEEAREFVNTDENGTYGLVRRRVPEINYAVMCGDTEFERGPSPWLHTFLSPYAPFFAEFIPYFGDVEADWVGIVRDCLDPQREVNKRRSEWLDILMRVANTGYIFEENAVKDKSKLRKLGVTPGIEIELNPGYFDKFKEKLSGQASGQLFQAGAASVQDINEISAFSPNMFGFTEDSRESGKAIMQRKQQGSVMLAPHQDNLRLTRHIAAKMMLASIPKIYTPARIARLVSPDGTLNTLTPEDLKTIERALGDIRANKYDVELSDTPQTPTQRVAEFVELREMIELMMQLGLPPNIDLIASLVKASDISQKKDVIASLQKQAEAMTQEVK
jgi:hypothetical protein